VPDKNSKRTRIEPIFSWLEQNGGLDWPTDLLKLADGIAVESNVGKSLAVRCREEKGVAPSPARLAWMIRNAHRLSPIDGRKYQIYDRVFSHAQRDSALLQLDAGDATGISRELRLEGSTCCDCLIDCENTLIWVEGKRNDWLSPSIEYDVARDQLSRNLESVWLLAQKAHKDYWLLICYENVLKHHEECLIEGYRSGTWWGGWPHLHSSIRHQFRKKIGTVRWSKIAARWTELRDLPELSDLAPYTPSPIPDASSVPPS
jgi:hypothetical protein